MGIFACAVEYDVYTLTVASEYEVYTVYLDTYTVHCVYTFYMHVTLHRIHVSLIATPPLIHSSPALQDKIKDSSSNSEPSTE